MRWRSAVALSATLCLVGCFRPFSWPEDRREWTSPTSGETGHAETESLTVIAECLERGDESNAVAHLQTYLQAHPDAVMLRLHLAELHYKHHDYHDARMQYERCVDEYDECNATLQRRIPHVHTRLMELAERCDDTFQADLHRGLGLLELVKNWEADPTRHDEVIAEQTLSQALQSLQAAKQQKPKDGLLNLALAEVYDRLGQSGAARACRRAARESLPDPTLTDRDRQRIRNRAFQE